jgi:hypothetical protein
MEWMVKHQTPLPAAADVVLEGLPKGVGLKGPPPRIAVDTQTVTFDLEASDETLLGPVGGIQAVIVLETDGQTIRQRAGQGTLRIDPAP